MIKLVNDKYLEMSAEEKVSLQAVLNPVFWHDSTRQHRFFLSFEQAADMAELFPEFAIDLSAAKLPVYKGELNGISGKFYYFNELYQHHAVAISEAGGVVENYVE